MYNVQLTIGVILNQYDYIITNMKYRAYQIFCEA